MPCTIGYPPVSCTSDLRPGSHAAIEAGRNKVRGLQKRYRPEGLYAPPTHLEDDVRDPRAQEKDRRAAQCITLACSESTILSA